jgi:hypothetical protein
MSASAATLTNEEYEERKLFLDELKKLVIVEQEEIFRILKKNNCDFSENSNGIFFDLSKLSSGAFLQMKAFLSFCQANRKNFEVRDREMEDSRLNLANLYKLE